MPMFRVGAEEWIFLNCLPVSLLAQSIVSPIWINAPRTTMPGTTLRAMAPAATRFAVSRALARPEPRQSRNPYFMR